MFGIGNPQTNRNYPLLKKAFWPLRHIQYGGHGSKLILPAVFSRGGTEFRRCEMLKASNRRTERLLTATNGPLIGVGIEPFTVLPYNDLNPPGLGSPNYNFE
jgi:hypothetical protein